LLFKNVFLNVTNVHYISDGCRRISVHANRNRVTAIYIHMYNVHAHTCLSNQDFFEVHCI